MATVNKMCFPEFQFHIGAIKRIYYFFQHILIPMFQFHIGAIKRRRSPVLRFVYYGFNSILVRLKVCDICQIIIIFHCFNSILVRLKVSSSFADFSAITGFNSILVRLKAPFLNHRKAISKVSIPYWCD